MAAVIYLDTHVVVWLYAHGAQYLSERVKKLIDESDLLISPVVLLELQLLQEIGRTSVPGSAVVGELKEKIGLGICEEPFWPVVEAASKEGWTRDPFDRIIVGHAALREAPLATKDQTIRDHYSRAVW